MTGLTSLLTAGVTSLMMLNSLTGTHQDTGEIELSVEGMREISGHVMIALYDSAEGWNANRELAAQRIAVTSDTLQVRFENIPAGHYAIALFHDANDDGEFNMNAFGIPTEVYGFSNDVFPQFRRARFEEAAFHLEPGATSQMSVTLRGVF